MSLDIELVKSAIRGDKNSFAQVYDYYSSDLYRVAMYTLGNSFDAEDVVSETFMESFKGIKNLRDPEKIKAWMMRILSIRCKRKIAEYIQARNDTDIEEVSFALSDSTDISFDTIQRVDLVEALEQLTQEERLIISLSTIQGYTVREVSDIMDKPQGTISSKLYRAIDKLRSILPDDY